jgi:predicted nuclease of predicted toxin-antitoxin system
MPDSRGLEALFIRLYLDRHIMTRLAVDLRARDYDVLTTEEAGKNTASDEEQLDFAARDGRAILTFNIRDFAPLHYQWQAAGLPHSGIIVSQQIGLRQYGVLLKRMSRLLDHFAAEDMVGNFVHLEQFK